MFSIQEKKYLEVTMFILETLIFVKVSSITIFKKNVLIVSPCIYVIVDKNETMELILFGKRCKVVRNKQTKKQNLTRLLNAI